MALRRVRALAVAVATVSAATATGCSGSSHPLAAAVDSTASVGDGFCEPALSSGGYTIANPPDGTAPRHRSEDAIRLASDSPVSDYGHYSAYFAMVTNPVAPMLNIGSASEARPTWVVEATEPHQSSEQRNPDHKGPGPSIGSGQRAVAFLDDATLQFAGAWGACE